MGPFFSLFLERTKEAVIKNKVNVSPNGDNSVDLLEQFLKDAPPYKSYEEFQLDAENNITDPT